MKYCDKCGKEQDSSFDFCPRCGTELIGTPSTRRVTMFVSWPYCHLEGIDVLRQMHLGLTEVQLNAIAYQFGGFEVTVSVTENGDITFLPLFLDKEEK